MRVIKNIAIVLGAVFFYGCNSTPIPTYNDKMSFSEYFSKYAITNCKQSITLDDFVEQLTKKRTGLYKNPFNESCVPFRFDKEVTYEYFEKAYDATDIEHLNIVRYTMNNPDIPAYKNAVALSHNRRGVFFSSLQFTDLQSIYIQKSRLPAGSLIRKYLVEFYFAHEIFHLSDFNHDKTIDQRFKEAVSDISGILAIKDYYELDEQSTLQMMHELNKIRKLERANRASSTHYDIGLFSRASNHMDKLLRNGELLPNFNSFKEIENYTLEFMQPIKRIHFENIKFVYRIDRSPE